MTNVGQPKIVFVGNCQASALSVAFNSFIAESADQRSVSVDWRNVRPHERQFIEGAETIVLQVSDLAWSVPEYISPSSRLVLFPYVSGGFLWPFASEGHVNYGSSRMAEFGVFGETGDSFLNHMIREGVSADDAADRYLDLDIVRLGKLDRRFELTLELQTKRDEIAGINVASFILSKIRSEPLFLGRGHLGSTLSRFVAGEVFKRLDASTERLVNLAQPNLQKFFEPDEHPIHPKVAAHLGLSYGLQGHRFRLHHGFSTFPEFCKSYVRGDFNVLVYDGQRMLHRNQDLTGTIDVLTRGINACPDSVSGLIVLADAYSRLEERSKSKDLLARAISIDPSDATALANLAGMHLLDGEFEQTRDLATQILQWHPGHGHGIHLLQIVRAHRP